MAEYLIQSGTLDDFADAINAKTGGSSAMTPAEMVDAIEGIGGGLSSPYSSVTGLFTPTSDGNSITIPLGVTITKPIVIEGHVIRHANYLTEENNNMVLGFYGVRSRTVVPTNFSDSNAVMFVLYSNSNHRSYYQGGTNISFSGTNLIVSNTTKGVVFKAGIPFRFCVIYYDGTDD